MLKIIVEIKIYNQIFLSLKKNKKAKLNNFANLFKSQITNIISSRVIQFLIFKVKISFTQLK